MNNHQQHNHRISRYKPNDEREALEIIYNLRNNDFNNYGQMVKDIKLICEGVLYGKEKAS